METLHFGSKQGDIETLNYTLSHERGSERSERARERSGARERSEQGRASKRVSGVSERANGRASGPVLTSRFLDDLNHSASVAVEQRERKRNVIAVEAKESFLRRERVEKWLREEEEERGRGRKAERTREYPTWMRGREKRE